MINIIIVLIILFLLFKAYSELTWVSPTNVQGFFQQQYGNPFRQKLGEIETRVATCRTGLQNVLKGIETLEAEALNKRREDFTQCKLEVDEAFDNYKKAFKLATGSEITDEQIKELKKKNSIDF